jgi:hypothetical protein
LGEKSLDSFDQVVADPDFLKELLSNFVTKDYIAYEYQMVNKS